MANKRKVIVLVCDGMADEPVEGLGGKTPLEAARTPRLDGLVRAGRVGLARTIPDGFTPASDVGNLAIFGYDPKTHYAGRAPLEAANLGVDLKPGEVVFRCNLVTADGDRLVDYCAGQVASEEAQGLIAQLDKQVGSENLRFYPGNKYRHLAVFRDLRETDNLLATVCQPPHDFSGWRMSEHHPKGPASERLQQVMEAARRVLEEQEINQVRIDLGENPANAIWLWGQGCRMQLPTFSERWGVTGSVISAVDLIKGAGRLAGLKVVEVPGATGSYDTNYAGKAAAAIEAIRTQDFVFVHLEAADQAGHNGHLREKLSAIESFDRRIVGPILESVDLKQVRVLAIPDHGTPVEKRVHTADPVPYVIAGEGIAPSGGTAYSEPAAKAAGGPVVEAHTLLPRLMTESSL